MAQVFHVGSECPFIRDSESVTHVIDGGVVTIQRLRYRAKGQVVEMARKRMPLRRNLGRQ